MIGYAIKADKDQIDEALSLFKFVGGNSDEAVRVAINKTAPKAKTQASREIRNEVRLKAAYVKGKLEIKKATRKKLTGAVLAPSRGLLLSKFSTNSQVSGDKVSWYRPPVVPPRGIRVKVKPTGGTKSVSGGSEIKGQPFYMILKNSRAIAIAGRRNGTGPRGGKIKVFYGPSLSQVFMTVKDQISRDVADEYTKQMLGAIRDLLVKKFPAD